MANQTRVITIDSILGGQSAYEHFSNNDQFKFSKGIDPDQVIGNYGPSGYIVSSYASSVSSYAGRPMWMVTEPKIGTNIFVYDHLGSVYTLSGAPAIAGLTDLNDGGTASGNGLAYYDNYIYASRDTTVARYGPLDGTPSWTDDYWVTTLSKAALTNTTYPLINSATSGNIRQPNHMMLRHSDGALYICDVVGNQGVLHKISTNKTTVEGDTDNGSTFNAIDFPPGMWPTALESYGDRIAIALYEGVSAPSTRAGRAKIAFWDPTNPTSVDLIFSEEFPDTIITALKNTNGVLYAFSGDIGSNTRTGLRVSRFAGGYTFEQIGYLDYAAKVAPGAVDTALNKVVFGSSIDEGTSMEGIVHSIGSKLSPVSNSLFAIHGGFGGAVTCLKYGLQQDFPEKQLALGTSVISAVTGLTWIPVSSGAGGEVAKARIEFPTFRIGHPFKVTKVILDLTRALDSNSTQTIIPTVVTDFAQYQQTTINYTNYTTKTHYVVKPDACTGTADFYLRLDFGGLLNSEETPIGVKLPITVYYELLPTDD